ncbi:hypothetical protein GCM10027403_02930 [Arthrobacter tecti]
MNTRSCLLTVGVSALLVTGSAFAAAPATAAPNSSECVTAQSALSFELGVASVDLTLANDLRDATGRLDIVGPELDEAFLQADLSTSDEFAAVEVAHQAVNVAIANSDAASLRYDGALTTNDEALTRLAQAEKAVADVPLGDDAALALAVAERDAAQLAANAAVEAIVQAEADIEEAAIALHAAFVASEEADLIFETASTAAFSSPKILDLQAQYGRAITDIDSALAALGATAGVDTRKLIALGDAAIAACSGAVVKPAVTVAVPQQQQQRGLNIQTAAVSDAGATDPANVAFLLGLAGLEAVAAAGAVVVVRRRSVERG